MTDLNTAMTPGGSATVHVLHEGYVGRDGDDERVAGTVTPQPVLAVVAQVDVPLGRLHELRADLVVVCVDVRDPGNAGTVLRFLPAVAALTSAQVDFDGDERATLKKLLRRVLDRMLQAAPEPAKL